MEPFGTKGVRFRDLCERRCTMACRASASCWLRRAENSRFDRWEGDYGVARGARSRSDRRGSVSARFERLRTRVPAAGRGGPGSVSSEPVRSRVRCFERCLRGRFRVGRHRFGSSRPQWWEPSSTAGATAAEHERHDLRARRPTRHRRFDDVPDRGAGVDAAGADRRESGRRAREERSAGDQLPARLLGVTSAERGWSFHGSGVTRWRGACVGLGSMCASSQRADERGCGVARLAHLRLLRPPPPPPKRSYGLEVSVSIPARSRHRWRDPLWRQNQQAERLQRLFPERERVTPSCRTRPESVDSTAGAASAAEGSSRVRMPMTVNKWVAARFRSRRGRR